jgi:hypothetical protein
MTGIPSCAVVAACASTLAVGSGAAGAAVPTSSGVGCRSSVTAAGLHAHAARVRVGITPGPTTGQLGVGPVPLRVPEDLTKQVAALRALRPAHRPFVLRLHRFFWSGGEAEVRRVLRLAHHYTRRGFDVELQLRYHPSAAQDGDIDAWVRHVRDVVRRFGPDKRVVAIQVTNEVNLTGSPDSSDGSFTRARQALVRGVVAAKDEARRRGYRQLKVGFNWAYGLGTEADSEFWGWLGRDGGAKLRAAVDWLGVDVYPGTFAPVATTPAQLRDGLLTALDTARCLSEVAGHFSSRVPIHIEETGWPTSATRTEAQQAANARVLLETVRRYARTFGVSDVRWFNLRDGDSTRPGFQTRYGLLRDDSTRKPAFAVVRDEFARMSR